jgi:hypothetical protein
MSLLLATHGGALHKGSRTFSLQQPRALHFLSSIFRTHFLVMLFAFLYACLLASADVLPLCTLFLQVALSPSAHAMQQPTWCKLRPENFQLLLDHADATVPENVLFVLGHANHQQGDSSEGAKASNSSTSGVRNKGAGTGSSRGQVGSVSGMQAAAAAAAPVTDKAAVQGATASSSSSQHGSSAGADGAVTAAGRSQAAASGAKQAAASEAAAAQQGVAAKHNLGRRVGMHAAGRDGR